MVVARTVTVAIAAEVLLGLSGCVWMRANLTNAADNLEYNANTLVRDAHDEAARTDDRPNYERDARALADETHDLRRAVADRAAAADIHASFERIRQSYHAVRDEVAHSDSLQARRDLGPLIDSYRDMEHELGIYPEREPRADYPQPSSVER